jgi:SP family general alpha glucoside:H+ symporter-like MFS transporter
MGIGFLGVGFLGTILSWFLLIYFGRRIIYNSGLCLLAVLQIIIGILDCVPNYINRPDVIWTQSSLMVVWNFFYDLVSP